MGSVDSRDVSGEEFEEEFDEEFDEGSDEESISLTVTVFVTNNVDGVCSEDDFFDRDILLALINGEEISKETLYELFERSIVKFIIMGWRNGETEQGREEDAMELVQALNIFKLVSERADSVSLLEGDPDDGGNTIAHNLGSQLTALQYHRFIQFMVRLEMTEMFSVKNFDGNTPIHQAFLMGTHLLPPTIDLLAEECNFNFNIANNNNGVTVLHIASFWAPQETLERLLLHGADLQLKVNGGESVIHIASANGNCGGLRYFLSLSDNEINATVVDDDNEAPIHYAVSTKRNFQETLNILVENGADINMLSKRGVNLIHCAARFEYRNVQDFMELVRLGCNWQAVTPNGQSILHGCAETGKLDALEYFLSLEGANDLLHLKDKHGETPLHSSLYSETNFTGIFDLFIEKGADINEVDNDGHNLVLRAIHLGTSREKIEYIVKQGGNWKVTNTDGNSVLHIAAAHGNVEVLEYFISMGADVNGRNLINAAPLHMAMMAKRNFHKVVTALKQHGADIGAVDKDGNSLAHCASLCDYRSVEDFVEIVKLGCNWKVLDNKSHSIMHLLAYKGRLDILKYFLSLEGANELLHLKDESGKTPLHTNLCSKTNFTEILDLFIENGLDINAVDNDGHNLVIWAIRLGTSREKIEYIVKQGGDWKVTGKSGGSVVHIAASYGNVDALEYFVSMGADVNEKSPAEMIPLHYSLRADQNFQKVVKALKQNGANIDVAPHHVLVHMAASFRKSKEDLEYLSKELECDWQVKDEHGNSALHSAVKYGNFEAIKFLVSLGADVNEKGFNHTTPLMNLGIETLTKEEFIKILRFLVEKKGDINASDCRGYTLLLYSAERGKSKEELEEIMKLGGDITNTTNNSGRSVLHLIQREGGLEALEYLISAGANVHSRDVYGETPLLHSVMPPRSENFMERIKILIGNGAELNAVSDDGNNLLFLAAKQGKTKQELEQIVDLGVDWRITDNKQNTILHTLATEGNPEALRYFIALGAVVNAKNVVEETPLFRVVYTQSNFYETANVLLGNGANVKAVNKWGYSVASTAVICKRSAEEVEFLVQLIKGSSMKGPSCIVM